MSKVEGTDAELRERFQAELPQIREWLDEFTVDEVQVAPGIRMFDPADRARSSGWPRRPGTHLETGIALRECRWWRLRCQLRVGISAPRPRTDNR